MSTHPIALDVRERLIAQAVDLHAGMDYRDAAGTEYLRGQAELIANSTGAYDGDEDAPQTIMGEILTRIQRENESRG